MSRSPLLLVAGLIGLGAFLAFGRMACGIVLILCGLALAWSLIAPAMKIDP